MKWAKRKQGELSKGETLIVVGMLSPLRRLKKEPWGLGGKKNTFRSGLNV